MEFQFRIRLGMNLNKRRRKLPHQIIIRGGEYSEDAPPPEGHASVEIVWSPSHALTEQQQGAKVAKLMKLANKIYGIESDPDES